MQKRTSIPVRTPEGEVRRAIRLTVPHAGNGHTVLARVLADDRVFRVSAEEGL